MIISEVDINIKNPEYKQIKKHLLFEAKTLHALLCAQLFLSKVNFKETLTKLYESKCYLDQWKLLMQQEHQVQHLLIRIDVNTPSGIRSTTQIYVCDMVLCVAHAILLDSDL
jgi:hypothetical protein